MDNVLKDIDEYIHQNEMQQQKTHDKKLKESLGFINDIARDFKAIVKSEGSDQQFQDAIKKGLDRLDDSGLVLDTEEEEDVCFRIENLMDIVALESSGGHLNEWRYGFDPNEFM